MGGSVDVGGDNKEYQREKWVWEVVCSHGLYRFASIDSVLV